MSIFSPKLPLIHHLDPSFFAGMRNTINLQTLKKLADLAKKIPEPEVFGSYRNDLEYIQALNLMLNSTNETRRRGLFIKRAILPLIEKHNNLLDIGPGTGQLTSWIGNNFNFVTVLDSNKDVIETLNSSKHILHPYIQFEKIYDSILNKNLNLKTNFYDLVLLSHVLYYIDPSKWLDVVKIAYQAACRGGIILIALSGGKESIGKAELIKNFGGNPIQIDFLIEECKKFFGSHCIQVYISKESIISFGILSMLHIAGFFLYDANATAEKNSLTSYIQKHYEKDKNFYKMPSQQEFVIIRKL